jgi:LuxR family maltose regulon positive regulatory protein
MKMTRLTILLSRVRPEMTHLIGEAYRRVESMGVYANDEVDFASPIGYPLEGVYAELACLLIALNRAAEALPLLTRLQEAAIKMQRHGDEIQYRVLMALAQHSLGNMQAALDALGVALFLGGSEGYIRLFVDEGLPMAELLRFALSQNIASDYASKLLAAFSRDVLSATPIEDKSTVNPQILPEPLSERENEVLRLMSEGRKYEEIAEKLVISINTVRHHIRNIYGKLGVNNRIQAIGKAKEIGLL